MFGLIVLLLGIASAQEGQVGASAGSPTASRALFSQTYRNWHVPCDTPGASAIRIVIDVELDHRGRFAREPALVRPQDSLAYRTAAASALKALRDTEPFAVPEGFAGGEYRPIFRLDRVCANVR